MAPSGDGLETCGLVRGEEGGFAHGESQNQEAVENVQKRCGPSAGRNT